jgi:PAS domain S-box-containing protein
MTWFLGDAVGVLVFGSLVLAVAGAREDRWTRGESIHLAVMLALTAFASWLVFLGSPGARTFYLYPLIVWAAFALRGIGASATLAVLTAVAVAGTTLERGPFSGSGSGGDLLLLQQYLVVSSVVGLLLAAVSDERRTQARTETERAESLAALRLAELESLYESAPIGLAFFDRQYRYLRINKELAAINGVAVSRHIGRAIREVLPVNAPTVEPLIDSVFATGLAAAGVEVSGETPQHPGRIRHWLTGFYPVKDEQGEVEAVGAWVIEITERKAAEEREALLAREVDHRAKNLLAVVQSVVQLTHSDDSAKLKEGIIGRIQSLARAHSLLAEARWDGAELGVLVAEELEPYHGSGNARVTVDGPPTLLRPAAAQSLAMVLHELATNAAKYGALSTPVGRLEVTWTRTSDMLELSWRETQGEAVHAPTSSGFGSRIIRASVERQLHGTLQQDWHPEGLHCVIRISAKEALGAGAA